MTKRTKRNPVKKYVMSFALILASFGIFGSALTFAPHAAYGATSSTGYCATVPTPASFTGLADVFKYLTCFVENSILPIFLAIAGLLFVWGMVKFIGTQEAAEREEGRQFMIWGVVGFAIIFCIWGLVKLIGGTFGIQNVTPTVSTPQTIREQ